MSTPMDQLKSPEQLARLDAGLKAADEADAIIQLAQQAGLDVTTQDEQNKKNKTQLLRIKNTFFPGQ